MKLTIDTDSKTLTRDEGGKTQTIALYSPQGFEWLSREWVRVGWDQKYTYTFTWLGRPIIQFPEDMLRVQEVLFRLQPDVIVETGVAHGGSLIYYASLCRLLGRGRVIGVDIEIRPHNRQAITAHPLYSLISLVEGDSTAAATVGRVKSMIGPAETGLVILDSCHNKQHVLAELEAYSSLVSAGSYLAVQDGIMRDLTDVPRGKEEWGSDNPAAAVEEFLSSHPEFTLETPARLFNESPLRENVTYWPVGWMRRRSPPLPPGEARS